MKCRICDKEFELKKENKYLTSETVGGMAYSTRKMYDTFDCTYCGCQNRVNERLSVEPITLNVNAIRWNGNNTINPSSEKSIAEEPMAAAHEAEELIAEEPMAAAHEADSVLGDIDKSMDKYPAKKYDSITSEQKSKIIELYNEGKSTNEIRKILKCSYKAVWSFLKKQSLEPINENERRTPRLER